MACTMIPATANRIARLPSGTDIEGRNRKAVEFPRTPASGRAPISPLANTANPATVTIGGKPARVLFAGLTPGYTALYQVNVVVGRTATDIAGYRGERLHNYLSFT
jgi:uracil-DNA glycosylase